MRGPMELVDEPMIERALLDGWGLRVDALAYVPVGAGAYHWIATVGGRRRFVTGDDLDTKPWLGRDRDSTFAGLLAAYRTAMELRADGLGFVAAPVAADSGEPALRLDERHSLSVFRYVDGVAGQWGASRPTTRRHLVPLLAELHRAVPPSSALERSRLVLPGRDQLELALDDLDQRWDAGPLGEPARAVLARHADSVLAALDHLDQVAAQDRHEGRLVVTHGEPHPGNLIRADGGLVLVDWDTVALAPPERDLWMIADDDAVAAEQARTGTGLDVTLLAAYRTLWALADTVSFTRQLRAQHRRDADTEGAYDGLRNLLAGQRPDPYGLRPG